MKKTFRVLVVQTASLLLGMTAWTVQAQMAPGPFIVPTDGGGTPIYANQEGYYGLSGGCADGKCGYRAVGSIENAMVFSGSAASGPIVGSVGVEPCGDACAPCSSGPCLPCPPCLPTFGGCGPCGNGILARIWNGPYYWQGPGCSERVIDELRKSWRTPCPQCDIYGETAARSPNSIGTGLRSAQIVGAGAPYGPIKMNAGQPKNGYYSVPVNQTPTPFQPGGCSSCRKGITVTAAQSSALPAQNGVPSPQRVQTYAQPYSDRNLQPVQYAEPIQAAAQPVQYAEPIQTAVQPSRFSGTIRYRSNYTPADKTPGYIRAQQNAEKTIGFDDIPQNGNAQSAWRPVKNQNTAPNQVRIIPASANSSIPVVPVDYQPDTAQLETIPTPAPRPSGSVLTSGSAADVSGAVPSAYSAVPYPAMGADCGIPCADSCGPVMPCEPAVPCGPCLPCGPCVGGGCWPGLIPLAADAVRFTGCAAFRVGRAAVVGTGMALRGSARAVGFVFWNRPLPEPLYAGPVWGGEIVGPAPVIDPVYAQNDFYLNASSVDSTGNTMNSNVGLVAGNSSANVGPNLYENGYYPQNYSVISDTAVGTLANSEDFRAPQTALIVPENSTAAALEPSASAGWSGTAALLTAQTQRVYLEDGTEVILEHDAMNAESRALNTSVQFASANDSAAPALQTAIPTEKPVPSVIPVSATASVPTMKTAALKPAESYARSASFENEQTVSNTMENPEMKRIPVPAGNLSADGYPVVASETPNIQLAPGEILVSQEDFILEPAEEYGEKTENSILVPVNNPREILESVPENEKEVSPAVKPIKDKDVTKVTFIEPIVKKKEISPNTQSEPQKPVKSIKTTESGWQIIER